MSCLKQCVGEGGELKVGRKKEDGNGHGESGEMRESLGHGDGATYFRRKQLWKRTSKQQGSCFKAMTHDQSECRRRVLYRVFDDYFTYLLLLRNKRNARDEEK